MTELPYTSLGFGITCIDAAALEQRLTDYSLALLCQFDTSANEVELRQRLALDMRLNAQGLRIWRQRMASH